MPTMLPICEAKVHCPTCRDFTAGRAWRESIAMHVETPKGGIDFECPYGVPWNENEQVRAEAILKAQECVHRGEQIDSVQCQSCGGVVMAKVMSCTIHGRCTLFTKPIDGVKNCRDCADRRST